MKNNFKEAKTDVLNFMRANKITVMQILRTMKRYQCPRNFYSSWQEKLAGRRVLTPDELAALSRSLTHLAGRTVVFDYETVHYRLL